MPGRLAILMNPARWEPGTRRTAIWALAVALLVCGWRLGAHLSGRRLRQVSSELVNVNLLIRNPVPDNAGKRVLLAQSTEEGVALSVLDCATRQSQKIYELPEKRVFTGSLLLLEWAPDDSVLAYAKPVKEKKQVLVLYNPAVGSSVGNIKVQGLIREFRWMSPTAFCYLNNSNTISVVARDAHGKWKHGSHIARTDPVSYLASLPESTVAWRESGAIWTWSASRGSAEQFWKPETNTLFSCCFSRENQKFLVVLAREDATRQVFSLGLKTKSLALLADTPPQMIEKANWINSGEGFAFQCSDHFGDSLHVWKTSASAPETLFPEGDVMDYRVCPGRIFLYGSEGSEPPGLWEYNLGAGQTQCLFSATPKPFTFAKDISHTWGTLTNNGREFGCPVCKKVFVLRKEPELKMTCIFCKGHIQFPAHSLGRKMPCPHCRMDITLKETLIAVKGAPCRHCEAGTTESEKDEAV